MISTTLYRAYDADGGLLYVGISMSPGTRFASHRRAAKWWSSATTITLQRYATRKLALAAEANAIREERPSHNRQGATVRGQRVTVEVPTTLHVEFRELAKLNERTFSQEIRKLMADYVERGRAAEKAAA